jgi:protein-disulfide isomerase
LSFSIYSSYRIGNDATEIIRIMKKLRPLVSANDHQMGNAKAKVTLVEYGDYECSHCGRAHPIVQQLVAESGDHLQFIFRHFPLEEVHPHAFLAACAAEAAGNQGQFWQMHDLLFDNQRRLSDSLLLHFARRLKLDESRYTQAFKSTLTRKKIEDDLESGIRSGVSGTPSFFLNGVPVLTYDGTYESLQEAITGNRLQRVIVSKLRDVI